MSGDKTSAGGRPDHSGIYERMRTRMLRMFGQQPWVQDVVNTAFETFIAKQGMFRGEGTIEAFALSIAMNAARDVMRRQRREAIIELLFYQGRIWPTLDPSPESRTDDRDRVRRLVSILERIKPGLRIPYLLYHVDGMPVAEIAGVEGLSEAAVRKRITRAREAIHRKARQDPVLREWLDARKSGT